MNLNRFPGRWISSPHRLVAIALVALTLAVYGQVGGHSFIYLDDDQYITNNAALQGGLTKEGLVWAFTTTYTGNWHPLTWLSHLLDVSLFGVAPGAHHLVNLLLHALNTLLLFMVLRRMTGGLWQSAFVAALFAVHPLHVESVAWVAERKDVLSTFLMMLTLFAYHGYVLRPGVGRYLAVLSLYGLGLLAKPMLVTLPFVLMLLDFWPLERLSLPGPRSPGTASRQAGRGTSPGRLVLEKIPLFLLSGISCAITYVVQQQWGAVTSLQKLAPGMRAANAVVAYATYVGKMFWPSSLGVVYPHPLGGLPLWQVAGAGILLAAVSCFVVVHARRRPYLPVGWFWYLGTLVPVSGLVQVGDQAFADRYTYIPLIGLFIAAAWGIPGFVSPRRFRDRALAAAGTGAILALAAAAWTQAGYWRDSVALFEHTLEVTPPYNLLVHNNLGVAYLYQERYGDAAAQFGEAVRINPNFLQANYNMGLTLIRQGRTEEAVSWFRDALRIDPGYAPAHYNLGVALAALGETREAVDHFRETLRLDPGDLVALRQLDMALRRTR